jgi:hypothetical protein
MVDAMTDNVRIGGGGRLYKDAREASNGHHATMPGEDTDGAYLPPKQHSDTLPSEPPQSHWVIAPIEPPAAPPAPPVSRDWRGFWSTLIEILGMFVLAAGLSLWHLWVGISVLGVCLIVLGVALGIPQPRRGGS